MLQFMRKQAKGWFVKAVFAIIIIVFIFYFGSMRASRSAEAIATVNGKPISYGEFQQEYRNMVDMFRQYYGGNITDDVMKKLNFKQQAYDNLINRAILRDMADKLKISVTDQEVMQSILSYPAFQRDGAFSQQVYQLVLKQNKISAEDFEAMQKNSLLAEKLRGIISEGAEISTAEVRDVTGYRMKGLTCNF